jgi:hypothetical protein
MKKKRQMAREFRAALRRIFGSDSPRIYFKAVRNADPRIYLVQEMEERISKPERWMCSVRDEMGRPRVMCFGDTKQLAIAEAKLEVRRNPYITPRSKLTFVTLPPERQQRTLNRG